MDGWYHVSHMQNTRFLKNALVALILFVASDAAWHAWLMVDFYTAKISAMGGTLPTGFGSVCVFQVIAALGTAYFLRNARTWNEGAFQGGLLSLMMVGAINLVMHGLLPGWDMELVLIDIGWGIVTGIVVGGVIGMMGKKG